MTYFLKGITLSSGLCNAKDEKHTLAKHNGGRHGSLSCQSRICRRDSYISRVFEGVRRDEDKLLDLTEMEIDLGEFGRLEMDYCDFSGCTFFL